MTGLPFLRHFDSFDCAQDKRAYGVRAFGDTWDSIEQRVLPLVPIAETAKSITANELDAGCVDGGSILDEYRRTVFGQ